MSFILIALIYVFATLVGVGIYNCMECEWWLALLVADVMATVITFVFSVIFGNASIYDPYWSVQPPVILLLISMGRELTLLGILLIVTVSIWGVRLTVNWAYTFSGLAHQDWRYTMLKEKTGHFYPIINFIGIHMVPTLVVWGCTLPAAFVIINGVEHSLLSFVFIGVSLLATLMQGVADVQMHKYRKNRNGKFIRNGLWKYSRHPNYLGEILMWWGVALAVVSASPDSWYLIAGAVSNTMLFLTVSIPMADKRQAKKDGFAEYKRATRMLLPIKK